VLRKPGMLVLEPNDSKQIMCAFVIYKYTRREKQFENVYLAKYVAQY
jgi:hypothetical protein